MSVRCQHVRGRDLGGPGEKVDCGQMHAYRTPHSPSMRSGRTLDDQVRPEDTHGRDTNTSLCGTVGGTEAGEDDGGRAAHRSEERLLFNVSFHNRCHVRIPFFSRPPRVSFSYACADRLLMPSCRNHGA